MGEQLDRRTDRLRRRAALWLLCCATAFACAPGVSGDDSGTRDDSETPAVASETRDATSETPAVVSETPDVAAFADAFDDEESGWRVSDGDDGIYAAYVDGAYEMSAKSGKVAVSPAPVTQPAAGITLRVEAERLEDAKGKFGGGWGVLCGEDLAAGRYYQAFIQVSNGVGYPGLFRWQDGEVEAFRKMDRPHDAIDPQGVNRLELECVDTGDGVTVTFSINGEEIERANDESGPIVASWETGLMLDGSPLPKREVITLRREVITLRFDNFAVEPHDP